MEAHYLITRDMFRGEKGQGAYRSSLAMSGAETFELDQRPYRRRGIQLVAGLCLSAKDPSLGDLAIARTRPLFRHRASERRPPLSILVYPLSSKAYTLVAWTAAAQT